MKKQQILLITTVILAASVSQFCKGKKEKHNTTPNLRDDAISKKDTVLLTDTISGKTYKWTNGEKGSIDTISK